MPAVAIRAGDELARARSVSSATTSPVNPTGPSDPPEAPNAARISSSVDGREGARKRVAASLGSMPVVAAYQRQHELPSSTVTGIAFDVAATSMPRNDGERLASSSRPASRSRSGAASGSGSCGSGGSAWATSMSAA